MQQDYCVGQPSAVVVGSLVYLYYSYIRAGQPGPNPGVVLLAVSADGFSFSPAANAAPLYSQVIYGCVAVCVCVCVCVCVVGCVCLCVYVYTCV